MITDDVEHTTTFKDCTFIEPVSHDYVSWLKRFSYKPTHTLSVLRQSSQIELRLKWDAPDARRKTKDGRHFTATRTIPDALDFETFRNTVADFILWVERHEALEWFRCDDEIVWDPHLPQVQPTKKRWWQRGSA